MKHEEYARMAEAEERQWWYFGMRAISRALLDSAATSGDEGTTGRRLLDAGCGTGNNLLHLGRHWRGTGLDIAPEAVRFCQARGVVVARGNVLALPFRDAAFDLVTSFDVLYHAWVDDDAAAVREMARVLRPSGLVLLRVPALRLLWGAHDTAVQSRHRYTRAEVVALLRRCGLEPLRATYANFFLFPLLLARRLLDRATSRVGSDVEFLPAPVEWAFRTLLLLEAALVARGLTLPIGTSVIAVGRRP